MAFQFPLASVLRIREIAHQREERLLAQILNQMSTQRQTLAGLAARREALIRQREIALDRRVPAAEIVLFQEQLKILEGLQLQGYDQLAKLASLRDHQMKAYEETRRSWKLLSEMRETQREQFTRRQVVLEQRVMDDIFSSRRPLL